MQCPHQLIDSRSCAQTPLSKNMSTCSSNRELFVRIVGFSKCLMAATITSGIKTDDSIEDFVGRVQKRRPKLEDVSGPNGPVDTTPAGVHTRFVRQFRSFHRKRPKRGHVDSVFLNNSSRCPHFRGVRPWSFRSHRAVAVTTPAPHWGEPFRCPSCCLGIPFG